MDKCFTCNHLLFLPFYLITSIYCFKQNTSVYHAFSNQKIQMYPAGIRHPCETKFDNHLQDLEHSNYTLNIPLIPTTPEEMEDMFRLCSHVRFKIPQQVRPTLENKRSMDYTLCVPTVDHNYRNVFKSSCILFVKTHFLV